MTACVAVLVASGCHTFMKVRPDYSDVPVEAVREVALEVERAVAEGEREHAIADREGVVVNTDTIKQAIRTRAARSHLVAAFRETGHVWERKNGLIDIIRSKEYKKFGTSRDRDRNALLVLGENGDRWAIYEGIVDASRFSPKSLPAIQRIFYEARLQVLADGSKYEDESGNLVYKGDAPAR